MLVVPELTVTGEKEMGKSEMNGSLKEQDSQAMGQIILVSSDNVEFVMSVERLKSHSQYIRGLLDSGMQETQNRSIRLLALSAECLRYVNDFLHQRKIHIEEDDYDSLSDVARAANYLMMTDLMNFVSEMVLSWLTCHNFDDVEEFIDQYPLMDAKQQMHEWIMENASDYIRSDSFLKRSYKEVKEILGSDDLLVNDELEVAEANIKWMKKHEELSDNGLCEELCEVRAGLMDFTSLSRCSKLIKPKKHKKLLAATTDFTNSFRSPEAFFQAHLGCKKRAENEYVISVGGFSTENRGSRQIQITPIEQMTATAHRDLMFHSGKEKLPKPLCAHCVCVLHGDIYVIGGETRYGKNGHWPTNEVHRFNTSICKWQKLQPMREARSVFYSGVVGGRIYAVSGFHKPDAVTRTVEQYNPETNTWRYVHGLDRGVHEHAGSVVNGKIYITGGYKGFSLGHRNNLRVFDPETRQHDLGQWIELAPMLECRGHHAMVPVANKGLVVAGGYKLDLSTDSLEDLQQCEYYDIALNQWTLLEQPLPYASSGMGYLLHENKLFLFGGRPFSQNVEERMHRKVQILNMESWEWTVASYTSQNVKLFPLELVILPKNFAMRFKPAKSDI